jgi:hypothetical protein
MCCNKSKYRPVYHLLNVYHMTWSGVSLNYRFKRDVEGIYILPLSLDTSIVCYRNAQWGSGQSNVHRERLAGVISVVALLYMK